MDERLVETRPSVRPGEAIAVVDGVPVASFRDVVARLRVEYPGVDPAHIEGVVLREWDAFSAGRPLVVPAAVEEGAREILDQSRI